MIAVMNFFVAAGITIVGGNVVGCSGVGAPAGFMDHLVLFYPYVLSPVKTFDLDLFDVGVEEKLVDQD